MDKENIEKTTEQSAAVSAGGDTVACAPKANPDESTQSIPETAPKRKSDHKNPKDRRAIAAKDGKMQVVNDFLKLRKDISALPISQLSALMFLIKKTEPSAYDESDPLHVEINLEEMKSSTLRKIRKYVEFCNFFPNLGIYLPNFEEGSA